MNSPLIVIANPGRQHSDQLAAALVEQGFRVQYFHGVPVRSSLRALLAGSGILRPLGRVIVKMGSKVLPFHTAERLAQATYAVFDRRVARAIRKIHPALVIAYENSAIASFRAARSVGATTILDAADVHFTLQNEAATAFRRRINRNKATELDLADYVLNCSALARESYLAGGVPADRAKALPLGVDLTQFVPQTDPAPRAAIRILFVGRLTRKKGADVLARALFMLGARGVDFEFRAAADLDNVEDGMAKLLAGYGELLGKVTQADLPALYGWGDIIVVPSRFDSFGLVVYEALACGLPALVSDHVGSKDIIVEGVNGHVFPADDNSALADALATMAADLPALRSKRAAARASVEQVGWSDYRRRAGEAVAGILNEARS